MCGINGIIDKKQNTKKHFLEAVNTIAHRGPDSQGDYSNSGIYLGHRRLSIHDLSEYGQQPMYSHSKKWIIVFNGEIYNYLELKDELLKSHDITFSGNSDTEVLINAIDVWGIEETLIKCVGMFAFAAYYFPEKKLFLARDRFGEKPLYYGIQKNIFAFASELKALKPLKEIGWLFDVDRNVLSSYMRYGYVPTPYSIYKDIFKLEPGTILSISENLELNKKQYWSPENAFNQERFLGSYQEAVLQLEDRLKGAVNLQMASDVPLGAFLSGGIDSSLIVSLMQAQSEKKINTFSIGSYNKSYNEAGYAKAVAQSIGTNHTELYVSEKEALSVIPSLPTIYDEPFADSSQIPTYLVSQLAKTKVTVALTGDSGDELFGGYNRYMLAEKVWRLLVANPLLKSAFQLFPIGALEKMPYLRKRYALLPDKLLKLRAIIKASKRSRFNLYKQICSGIHDTRFVLNSNEPDIIELKGLNQASTLSYKEWMMFADAKTYMMDDILTKVDRAAMAISLETRVPFLDHRIYEFAWSLPLGYKIKNGVGKRILRDILYKYVPRELIERPKMGFGVPIGDWLRGDLKEWAAELLNEQKVGAQGYFDASVVNKYWQEHQSGKRNWQAPLWHILMFQSWLESEY